MKGEWRMGRKLFCVLFAVVYVMGLAMPVSARSPGEIRVTLDFGDGEVHDGSVMLCLAATAEGEDYRLTETFGSGMVKREDIVSDALALWLSEIAIREGASRILDADGSACFTDLQEGVYLLLQTEEIAGIDPIKPMLILLPSSGAMELAVFPLQRRVYAQCPQTGQSNTLLLGAMGMVLFGMGLLVCLERIRRK
jgi:hypothetical protein